MRLLPSSYEPKAPSEFQVALLKRIHSYEQQHGECPSLVEMATDRQNLERLRLRGWANWDPKQARSLHVTEAGRRLIEAAEARS